MQNNSRWISLGLWALVGLILLAGTAGWWSAWGMPRAAQVSFTILLVAAILWISELVPLFVTSFLILFLSSSWLHGAMKATGLKIDKSLFLTPFFSNIILLFLGGFVLSAALRKYRLDERLARRILLRTGGSPPRVVGAVMVITAFLSMWLSNTATAAMMIALCIPLVDHLPEGSDYRRAIFLAIPFSANVGGLGTPIGTPPNAIAMQYLTRIGEAPGFASWMALALPFVVLILILIWAILMWQCRGSTDEISVGAEETEMPPLGRAEWFVIAVSIFTVLGWLTGKLHGLPSGTVALIPVLAFFGPRLLGVRDFRGLSWDVLILMGGGLCLGVGMAESGLARWFIGQMPTEGAELSFLVIAFGGAAVAMSSVMSNTATANLIMPIVIGLGLSTLSPLLVAVAFCCSMAMPLPISTPPNAIAFSSGQISVRDMLMPGLIITLAGVGLTFAFGLWWWRAVGLF